MTRRLIFVALLVALVIGGGLWWQSHDAPPPGWQGYVDADYVRVGPTLGGQLVSLSVHRGAQVAAGAPLFAQDEADDLAARNQAAATLAEAENRLTNLEKAGRETEITQAEADLADMRATRDRIATDLNRNRQLLRAGAATQQTVDQQQADLTSAIAHVKASEAKLQQMQDPTGRQYEIAAQRAVVAEQRAALAQAEWRLAQRRVVAPAAARRRRHLRSARRDGGSRRAGRGTAAARQHPGAVLRPRDGTGDHPARRAPGDHLRQLRARPHGAHQLHRAATGIHAAGDL